MKALLDHLLAGNPLSEAGAGDLLRTLTDPEVPEAWKGAALAAMRVRGETAGELRGMALAMREAAHPIHPAGEGPLVDTCGTGGDHSNTINLSTAASLVVAACDARVVKHGNRSVSSRSGSADVLEELGVALPDDAGAAEALLGRARWTFLFAPVFHPSMKAVGPVRRALRARTIFNLLGPLTNPAAPPYQLIGAFSPGAARLVAEALSGMPIERAAVVHGAPAWDEATPVGPFERWDVWPGRVEHRVVDPQEGYGVERCAPADLEGGDAAANAQALRTVFEGAHGPHRDAILLNAALALEVAGMGEGREAMARAAEAIDSGAVLRLVGELGVEGP